MTMTLYTNPMSRGRIARWMLEESGAPCETVVLGYGPHADAQVPGAKPDGQGSDPAARRPRHGRCAAICAYFADAFPEVGLAPPPAERAVYCRWLFFGAGPVEAAVTNRSLGWEAPKHRGRLGYGDFTSVMDNLEVAVTAAPCLAGERFSAAEVYFGAQIGWGLAVGTIDDCPAFRACWQRLECHPAFARAAKLDETAAAAAEAPSPEAQVDSRRPER